MKQIPNNNVNINIEFPIYAGNGDLFLSRFEDIFKDNQISDIEKAGSFTRRLPDEVYIKLKSICSPTDFINPSILIEKFRLLHPRKSTSSNLLLFNAALQGKNESYIDWVSRLCILKNECLLSDSRVIEKVKILSISKNIRQKITLKENITLEEVLTLRDDFEELELKENIIAKVENISLNEKTENDTTVKHVERLRGRKTEENKQLVRYGDHDERQNLQSNYDNRQRWTARGHDFQRNIYQGNNYNPSYQGNNYNPRYQNYNANYYNVRANYPGSYNNSSRFDNRANYIKNDYNNNRFNNDYNYRYNRHYNDSRCIQRYNDNHNIGNRGTNQVCNYKYHNNDNNQSRYTNKVNTVNIEEIKEDDNDKLERK
ncbi:probable cyclin-dependent serine/threonine-protein kinase DDB_G0292550 [Gordionus sp. m RMFG-2023]|uniref:probable cyclin-dependent serine/threonine-protein kinase DDB_G0292550 n=1 Tax=Gordionus sp. m RMFG-2023 TaxID=3053472 RepID=UPI0031FDC5F2